MKSFFAAVLTLALFPHAVFAQYFGIDDGHSLGVDQYANERTEATIMPVDANFLSGRWHCSSDTPTGEAGTFFHIITEIEYQLGTFIAKEDVYIKRLLDWNWKMQDFDSQSSYYSSRMLSGSYEIEGGRLVHTIRSSNSGVIPNASSLWVLATDSTSFDISAGMFYYGACEKQ